MLTDIRLGDITGLDVLRAVKKKSTRTTVVIIISAYSTTEIAVEAMNEGAYDFVPKPLWQQWALRHHCPRLWNILTLDQEKGVSVNWT